VQITGSHNPPEFNGFKMVVKGESIHGEEILDLYEIIVQDKGRSGTGKESADASVLEAYKEAVVARNRLARPVRVVVDCGNGVASLIAVRTLQALGAEVTTLFCESDGTFPNHHPDPTVPENLRDLQRVVRTGGAELGIAFDGDGDRIGAVDETGQILFGDQLLVIFGRDAVRRFGPGVPVIFDVKCSELLPRALREAGARPEMWKTGHSLIKARMKELDAPLAGEMSGHIFFAHRYLGFDDGVYAGARLLELLTRSEVPLAALYDTLPVLHNTPEIRVECPDDLKFAVVAHTAASLRAHAEVIDVIDVDGVRARFSDGWGLVRASNTQPSLVLRCEAVSAQRVAEIHAVLEAEIARARATVRPS
jgi:phosphomannomutase/phosphoglucomutase